MIKQQLFIGAALIAGVAIGYFAAPQTSVKTAESETDLEDIEFVNENPIDEKGSLLLVESLQARVRELEALLASSNVVAAVEEPVEPRVAQPRVESRFDFEKYWEDMKKNDPEGYTRVTNRVARMRQRSIERRQSKLDFLSSIDVSEMSVEGRETHARLQDLIIRRDELDDEMIDENTGWERRRELFRQMAELDGEMRHVAGEERRNLLQETARVLGFDADNAQALVDTVQEIISATDNEWRGPRPGGWGGPRGGRGGRGR